MSQTLKYNKEKLKELTKLNLHDVVAEIIYSDYYVTLNLYSGEKMIFNKRLIAEELGIYNDSDYIIYIIDSCNYVGEHIQQEIEVPIEECEFSDKQIESFLYI